MNEQELDDALDHYDTLLNALANSLPEDMAAADVLTLLGILVSRIFALCPADTRAERVNAWCTTLRNACLNNNRLH